MIASNKVFGLLSVDGPGIIDATGAEIATVRNMSVSDTKIIASRLVDCWNACAGLNPDFLEDFLVAARKVIRQNATEADFLAACRLLAKLEGRK